MTAANEESKVPAAEPAATDSASPATQASPGADSAAAAPPPAGIAAGSAAAAALLNKDEYTRFLLHTRNEITSVLRGLVEHVSQVTMFFNEGRDMVITSIVSYDDHSLVMDFGPSSELNRKALAAERLFCVTQLDKVKIQFLLRGLERIEENGRPAFKAKLPTDLLRLQRREFYRLITPIARPLQVVIPLVQPDGSKRELDAQIGDISGGGLGIVGIPKSVPLETGMEFNGLRIELPEVGQITANVRVCSTMEIKSRSGLTTQRAGCEFIKLPGPMMTLIQRYIIRIERERKARESGMG